MKSFLTLPFNDGCVCLFVDPFGAPGWKISSIGEFKLTCPHGTNVTLQSQKTDLSRVDAEKLKEIKEYIKQKTNADLSLTEKQMYENLLTIILSIEGAIAGGETRNFGTSS